MATVRKAWRFDKVGKRYKSIQRQQAIIIGVTAVNFFKKSFVNQGFTNVVYSSWKPLKSDIGKTILVRSGALRDSIRIKSLNPKKIVVGVDGIKYAAIHNEGGTTHPRVTDKMRGWAWSKYYETGNDMYKAIALTKKSKLTVKIPQRKYLGNSVTLNKQILTKLNPKYRRAFKNTVT